MEFQRAFQQLNSDLAANYALFGTEHYLRQQFLQRLLSFVNDQDLFEQERFDLLEVGLQTILEAADSFSFFAEKRIIIVENAHFLVSTNAKVKVTEHEQEQLLRYLENPNTASIVIWLMEIDQLDKRKKVTKAFQKYTHFVECQPMNEKDLTRYVQQYIQEAPFDMAKDAVLLLLERVGYQLSGAMSEIHKLQTYAYTQGKITAQHVQQLVPRSLETDVFELSSAVLRKDLQGAIQIYHDLLLAKNEPIALLALLVAQFRLLIQVSLMAQKNHHESDIASLLGIHPYRVKLALQSSRQRPLNDLLIFYRALATTDYQLKTGIGLKDVQFELLLSRML